MIGTDIDIAQRLLRQGSLVAIPTETVYGLAADALNTDAVINIFEAKKRPFFDPLIIHVPDIPSIKKYVEDIPVQLLPLIERYMPGPLTLLLPRKSVIPDLVTAGLPRVAVRIPSHPLTRRLLQQLDFPLAAPSANPFGYISPTTPQHVESQLGDIVPYILDGGPCRVGVESTIVSFENDLLTVYRQGGIPLEELEQSGYSIAIRDHSSSNPNTPGTLDSHYAPRCKMVMYAGFNPKNYQYAKIGCLSFSSPITDIECHVHRVLSPTGNMHEAARNLFDYMRQLDELDLDVIVVDSVPNEGLGRAINDRLKRACY